MKQKAIQPFIGLLMAFTLDAHDIVRKSVKINIKHLRMLKNVIEQQIISALSAGHVEINTVINSRY